MRNRRFFFCKEVNAKTVTLTVSGPFRSDESAMDSSPFFFIFYTNGLVLFSFQASQLIAVGHMAVLHIWRNDSSSSAFAITSTSSSFFIWKGGFLLFFSPLDVA